jgi:hypothetical protein
MCKQVFIERVDGYHKVEVIVKRYLKEMRTFFQSTYPDKCAERGHERPDYCRLSLADRCEPFRIAAKAV